MNENTALNNELKQFKYEYKQINSRFILTEKAYQRPINAERVRKIVTNFDPNLVNPVKVSFRDGKYYVFDGQHTLTALFLMNNRRHLMINCKVYCGMTYEDEARLFAQQNGIARPVASGQKLLSLYEAKDPEVVSFKQAVESLGIKCAFRGQHKSAPWKLLCYQTAFDIFSRYGEEHMKKLLSIITEAWNGEADSFRREIIMGLNSFLITYAGEYKRSMLVKKLSKVAPIAICRDGKAFSTGGSEKYARIILNIYNRKTNVGRLEDKL